MPNLKEKADTLLSSTTVAFNANGQTTLYTVPTGKTAVLTKAVIIAAGDAGATTTITIGRVGTLMDFLPTNTLSNLDAAGDVVICQPVPNTTPLKLKTYAAGVVIQVDVGNQSGAAGNTVKLFGFIY